MTEVVAALIWDGKRFMACQRPAHKARGLLWEFVGGKVEPGESREEALIRECREELGVTISVGEIFMEVVHHYPDLTVHLTLFHSSIAQGTPQKLEHNDIRWITVEEIDQYAFCPADREILDKMKLRYGARTPVQDALFSMQDRDYKAFHSRLMPTIDPEQIIGVRIPALRSFAKQFAKSPEASAFLRALPHAYYEENNLHGFLISMESDYDRLIGMLEAFLPYVDNWATCDLLRPKFKIDIFPELLKHIQTWLRSDHPYTVRFGIEMLMVHFLDGQFQPEYLDWVASIRSEEYYVNMMVSWYFATALSKQYEAAIPYLQQKKLPVWTHNKTIRKAIESYRITPEQKVLLQTMSMKRTQRPR